MKTRSKMVRCSLWASMGFIAVAAYTLRAPAQSATPAATITPVQGRAGFPLVVIDAGHGSMDRGVVGVTGLQEKDVSLGVARAVRDALVASGKFRVAMTRDDDRYLSLGERSELANRLKADLFISIHCDVSASPDTSGAAAYTNSSVATDKDGARMARRENNANSLGSRKPSDDVADITSLLMDLTDGKALNASAAFVRVLGNEAKGRIPVQAKFHRMAPLNVLQTPESPAVLFDAGFLSNTDDSGFLSSKEGRARVAQSLSRAVVSYFASSPTQKR